MSVMSNATLNAGLHGFKEFGVSSKMGALRARAQWWQIFRPFRESLRGRERGGKAAESESESLYSRGLSERGFRWVQHAETVAQKNKRRGERDREVRGAEERIRLGVKRAPSGSGSFKCHPRRPRVCCRGCSVELRASANTYAEPIARAVRACSECSVPMGKRAVCGSWKAEKGADKDSRRGGTWCSFSFQDGILKLQLHHISQVLVVGR